MRTMMLLALLLALPACLGSTAADIAAAPPSLMEPCAEPQTLPVRVLPQNEAEVFWGRDRGALRDCGDRHALLVEWAQGQVGAR